MCAIATMLNVSIMVFSYGDTVPEPRWTEITPDPLLYDSSNVIAELPPIMLYHADECHYELLILRDFILATQGPVPNRLQRILSENSRTPTQADILRFKPCPRGRGRPKIKREGKPYAKKKKNKEK